MRPTGRASAGTARRGFAAPLAVCLLAAVGGLAATSLHSVAEARRSAHRGARQEEAASAADTALARALAGWDVVRRDSLPIGALDAGPTTPDAQDAASARVYVIRITNHLFWVAAVGRSAPGTSVESQRAHHLAVEVLRPEAPVRAALTSRGDVVSTTATHISGVDATPPGWVDCPPGDTIVAPAVLVPPGVGAQLESGGLIEGARADSLALDPATYERLGAVRTAALAYRADVSIGPGAIVSPAPDIQTACRAGDAGAGPASWGEPLRTGESLACERFYPVVHAAGDLLVTSGRGQGVLIVNGRLRIQGPFLFSGVVIAFDGVDVSGSDVRIYGTVLADGRGVTWRGSGELRRSTCAVDRAAAGARKPYPLSRRGWAELP